MEQSLPSYTITFQEQWLSLNKVYSSQRWLRHQENKLWKEKFTRILTEAGITRMEGFKLRIRWNTRMDLDNLTGGTKIMCDTMKLMGLIEDDNRHVYQDNHTSCDLDLPFGTIVISITPVPKLEKRKRKPAPKSPSVKNYKAP